MSDSEDEDVEIQLKIIVVGDGACGKVRDYFLFLLKKDVYCIGKAILCNAHS